MGCICGQAAGTDSQLPCGHAYHLACLSDLCISSATCFLCIRDDERRETECQQARRVGPRARAFMTQSPQMVFGWPRVAMVLRTVSAGRAAGNPKESWLRCSGLDIDTLAGRLAARGGGLDVLFANGVDTMERLLEFGFRWDHLRDRRRFPPSVLGYWYGLDPATLQKMGVTFEHLCNIGYSAEDFRHIGIGAAALIQLGMRSENFFQMPLDEASWKLLGLGSKLKSMLSLGHVGHPFW